MSSNESPTPGPPPVDPQSLTANVLGACDCFPSSESESPQKTASNEGASQNYVTAGRGGVVFEGVMVHGDHL